MKQFLRSKKSICFLALLLALLMVSFMAFPIHLGRGVAEEENVKPWERETLDPSEPIPCNQKTGTGAVFYKFEKIVVYYHEFPVYEEQQKPDFPPELRFDAFTKRLLGHLQNNFATCLKTKNGKEKPIVVIPTHRSASAKPVYGGSIEKAVRESIDPRNLIVMLSVRYRPEDDARSRDIDNYGYINWAIQRPGVGGWESLPLVQNRSGVRVFFPGKDDLGEHFDWFGEGLKPIRDLTPPHYDGGPLSE